MSVYRHWWTLIVEVVVKTTTEEAARVAVKVTVKV